MAGAIAAVASLAPALPARSNGCDREAASIRKAETRLPRLEIAPPADQQIVCITLGG